MMPTTITDKLRRLTEICDEYPNSIPVEVAAEFNGTHPESLRNSLKEGTCPFGYAWNRGSRSGFCIPTIRFCLWITGGEVECVNQIKCGICPYYNAPGTHCDAADNPAVKVNVCLQRRIRKAVKVKEAAR